MRWLAGTDSHSQTMTGAMMTSSFTSRWRRDFSRARPTSATLADSTRSSLSWSMFKWSPSKARGHQPARFWRCRRMLVFRRLKRDPSVDDVHAHALGVPRRRIGQTGDGAGPYAPGGPQVGQGVEQLGLAHLLGPFPPDPLRPGQPGVE